MLHQQPLMSMTAGWARRAQRPESSGLVEGGLGLGILGRDVDDGRLGVEGGDAGLVLSQSGLGSSILGCYLLNNDLVILLRASPLALTSSRVLEASS